MRNKRIKALILAAIVTVTSAAFAGCSKSSDDELITVKESDLDSMSNEEIESIIVHNAEVLEQADSTTAVTEPELPVYDIWDDVVVTPDNEKRSGMYEENRGAFIIEYTGDNEDVKNARIIFRVESKDEDGNYLNYANGDTVTVKADYYSSLTGFEIEPVSHDFTVSGAIEKIESVDEFKALTNLDEIEKLCDERIGESYNLDSLTDRKDYMLTMDWDYGDGVVIATDVYFSRVYSSPEQGGFVECYGKAFELDGELYVNDNTFSVKQEYDSGILTAGRTNPGLKETYTPIE